MGTCLREVYPTFPIPNRTPDPDLNPCISFTGVNPIGIGDPKILAGGNATHYRSFRVPHAL